jgi:RHH-type transcriptional regulator, proline utilization regulon repressor / proline dehydrogenase / delta 1-pyrroline-5-carboxylate dehydrogenase
VLVAPAPGGMNQRLRVYVPFGELLPGMAYLVRRLLENTSSQSFLRMGMTEGADADAALTPPPQLSARSEDPASETLGIGNEPVRRFTDEGERAVFRAALEGVRAQLGAEYSLVINGKRVAVAALDTSINPSKPSEVVGRVAAASPEQARQAVAAAEAALEGWRSRTAEERVAMLRRTATVMRRRRDELAAWQVFEAGKPWRESDADVCEAIDFCEYYAAEMLRLLPGQWLNTAGETNHYFYEPRGVGAVIAPWNFPLAILTGMTAAAIVAGNTVVVKPAPQTPVMAAMMIQCFEEAGLPPGVLNFLPGGDEVGDALVRHPRVAFVAFTGSEAVGKHINVTAAHVAEGQNHLKRVIAELGGKNAIIVDDDADLDDAVRGVALSAFAYAGQKCSACSRAIVVGDVHDVFVARLIEASRSLTVGPADDPGAVVGPVIDAEAHRRIRDAIDRGKREARCVLETDVSRLGEGYFIGPAIFADVNPDGFLAQEEIFGPVLSVMRARDFEHAIELANHTRYALTGGVYSRSPAHLEEAKRRFRVGNLYLNRKITGAVVGRQPFGGFKMSGVGSKAGGPDYLLQLMEPRTITENTIRRGFAPAPGSGETPTATTRGI